MNRKRKTMRAAPSLTAATETGAQVTLRTMRQQHPWETAWALCGRQRPFNRADASGTRAAEIGKVVTGLSQALHLPNNLPWRGQEKWYCVQFTDKDSEIHRNPNYIIKGASLGGNRNWSLFKDSKWQPVLTGMLSTWILLPKVSSSGWAQWRETFGRSKKRKCRQGLSWWASA